MSNPFVKKLEHGIKWMFFTLSQLYLKKGRDFAVIDPSKIKKVLFLRPEKLGDMVISLPVFHNLKKLYPHIKIYTISSPKNIAIVSEDASIEHNFLYTKNILKDIKTVRQIRKIGIDVVADMICDDSVTALFLTQYSSPKAWRIGLGKTKHKEYYDFNYLYRSNDASHVVDNTIKLLTAFGIDTESLEKHIPPTIRDEYYNAADKYLALVQNGSGGDVIGLNLSAGKPTRVWPENKNQELVEKLLANYPSCRIVVSSDPSERTRALEFVQLFPKRVFTTPEGLNLLEVSAILSRLRLLITPDTSLVHIARAFSVPVVGLYTQFGKNFRLWKPFDQEGGTVISNNDYNIFDVEVEAVYNEIVKQFPLEAKA
ncbi:MAG: glycosyltransferase family 9 protein [candidate division Zixibacteria bacterium]|nr:glycosyltransferase family 9 protein [candidate division Zixibacteria bacterium]